MDYSSDTLENRAVPPDDGFEGDVLAIHDAHISESPRQLSVLFVRPRRGRLTAGAAHLLALSGRVYLLHILGVEPVPPGWPLALPSVDTSTVLHVLVDRIDRDFVPGNLVVRQEPGASAPIDPLAQDPAVDVGALRQEADRYWDVRIAAVQALAALGEQMPVEPLLLTFSDEHGKVRWRAINAVAGLGSRAPLDPFLGLIGDTNSENQGGLQAAARVLGMHPEEAPIEPLLALLRDSNPSLVRFTAADALARLGDRVPLEALLEAFAVTEGYPLRGNVARALVQLGDRAPLEPLIAALEDPDMHARVSVAHEVLRLGDRLPSDARARAEQLIEELETLRRRMAEQDATRLATQEQAIEAGTREDYSGALADPAYERRVAAVKGLGRIEEPPLAPVVEALLTALNDDDGNVQMAAADALATLYGRITPDEPGAVNLGEQVLEGLFARVEEGVDDVEFAAREALLALAPQLPLAPFVLHAGDERWEARRTAIEALAARREEAPEAVFVTAIADPARDIRETALQVVQTTYPATFAAIVQEAEQILLGNDAGPYFRPLVEQRLAEMIRHWKLTSAEAVATLSELFASPSPMVRVDALRALEAIWEAGAPIPAATHEQVRHLRTDPASRSVQEAARRLVERVAPLTELLDTLDDTPES